MKKKYIEPQMIVEDFTVSEMVAADCKLATTLVTFVKQMNSFGKICCDGEEPYFKNNGERGAAYDLLCGIYDGNYDTDGDGIVEGGGDGVHPTSDMTFSPAWRQTVIEKSGKDSACHVDGSSMTFDHSGTLPNFNITCTSDTTLLQNS